MTRYLEIKPGSIAEVALRLRDDYQAFFKKELEKAGKGIAQMTDAEKKAFFNRVDKEYNAKNEIAQTMPAKKPEDSKTTMVVKPGAPAGQEKVIRIPKEKLADYKKKGYIEAESYIPEAKKIDELTAGQKKLPPALQKAIKAKEKNEDIASMNPNYSPQARDYAAREKDIKPKKNEPLSQVDLFLKKMKDPKFAAAFRLSQKKENTNEAAKNPYAIGMAAAMKATGDKPPLKKSTITKAHDIAKSIEKNEEVDLDENISQVTTKKNGTDTDIFYKGKHIGYYHKITPQHGEGKIGSYFVYHDNADDPEDFTQSDEVSSEAEAKKVAYDTAKFYKVIEEVQLEDKNSGGIYALRAIKAKRLRLQGELEALNKDDPNYKEKAANLRAQIEKQKEIMANKQKEVYSSFDPSLDDLLDLYEGGLKDIDVRKGDLRLAKDKRQALKDKYNAIMANQAQGDEDSIADQIRKLDMSIKKQEQELIDIMKKIKDSEKNEAVDPERISNLQKQLLDISYKLAKIDKSDPDSKTKEAILKADAATKKLRLKDLIDKRASDVKKTVNEASKAKQSYKTLKMSLKKEQETDNKKKTLTDKPLTKVDVDPKLPNN